MTSGPIQIELVYALPDRCWRHALSLPVGATVAQALSQAEEWLAQLPPPAWDIQRVAVFGQRVAPDAVLHDGDRIEILRPLLADPKQARRQRAQQSPRRSRKAG